MHPYTLLFAVAAAFSLSVYYVLNQRKARKSSVPVVDMPGPKQTPYFGRIHDLPINLMWEKFEEWAQIYGPIYFTSMLGTKFIIISDEKIAEELLVKRAKIYSDRPNVMSLYNSKLTYLPLMGKNHLWARQRKFTHSYLTEVSNAHYHGVMDHEVKRWMHRLITEPETFQFTLEDMASKIMCTLAYDQHDFSPYYIKSAWGLLTQMSPAGPITNVLTPLWKIPTFMNPWKLAEIKRRDEQNNFWLTRLLETRERMRNGLQRPCFMRKYLENADSYEISGDQEASCVIGMMALVGIFTVAGPLQFFLVAMVHHPEWQKKLQEELDREIGNRTVTVADTPKLPVLRACIKETMRWRPNVPTGVAHEAEADDFYRGYFIEKGTRILPLDIAFLKNPVNYPDPENYRPERWLEPGWPSYKENLEKYPTLMNMTSFGYGQRKCLGMTLTQDELVVACGTLMNFFTLKKKISPTTGAEIEVPTKKTNSLLIIKPDPFEMAFEVRSEKKKEQIMTQWAEADAKDLAEKQAFIAAARKMGEAESEKRALEEKLGAA